MKTIIVFLLVIVGVFAAKFDEKGFKVRIIKESQFGAYDTTFKTSRMLYSSNGYYYLSDCVLPMFNHRIEVVE